MYHDFIGVYENFVDPNLCEWIIDFMERSPHVIPRNFNFVDDKQICMDAFSPGEAQALNGYVNDCLKKYADEYVYLQQQRFISSLTLLQKTQPTKGYHHFHSETISEIFCQEDFPDIDSHHDVIVSSVSIPFSDASSSKSDISTAPKVDKTKHKLFGQMKVLQNFREKFPINCQIFVRNG